MGAHYGAVFVRDVGRRQVRTLLEQFAAEKNTRFLLAPVIRGWLGVYPKEYGADGAVAERIATSFDAPVLYVYLHDDSLLGYSYFRGGRLIDEYCSDPEYFESVSQAEQARLRGRPEVLVDLLASPDVVPQLDAVLHPADGTLGLATFALKDFARLLNLPNACTCYEYLLEDGWVERVMRWFTIRGLWRFQHVPDLRPEKQARRRRLSQRAQSWQQLKRNGKLLAYQPGRVGWIVNSEPHVCPNQAGDGFYVFSENERDSQVREISPPWDVPPRASGLVVDATRSVMALSPSGRWLAIGHGYETGHTELWDMSQPAKFKDLPTTTANEFDFTADESKLLAIGAGELMVFDLPDGNLLKRCKLPGSVSRGVFDPSGRFIVLVLADELVLFDWQRGKRLRRWKLGERIDPAPEMEAVQEELRSQLEEVTPADFDKHFRKMAQQLNLPVGESEKMLNESRQNYSKMMAMLQSNDWAEQVAGVRGSESPVRVRFSSDGRLLLCATDQGLRVYRWAEFPGVLEAFDGAEGPIAKGKKNKLDFQFAPAPLYAVDGEAYQEDGEEEHFDEINPGSYIYALEYDAAREHCLYAGMGGTIGSLDLATGEHHRLAELPGRPTIMQLALSRDGRALACTTLPQFFRSTKKLAAEVCVWNYIELLA